MGNGNDLEQWLNRAVAAGEFQPGPRPQVAESVRMWNDRCATGHHPQEPAVTRMIVDPGTDDPLLKHTRPLNLDELNFLELNALWHTAMPDFVRTWTGDWSNGLSITTNRNTEQSYTTSWKAVFCHFCRTS
jgi:hypothetical protein